MDFQFSDGENDFLGFGGIVEGVRKKLAGKFS